VGSTWRSSELGTADRAGRQEKIQRRGIHGGSSVWSPWKRSRGTGCRLPSASRGQRAPGSLGTEVVEKGSQRHGWGKRRGARLLGEGDTCPWREGRSGGVNKEDEKVVRLGRGKMRDPPQIDAHISTNVYTNVYDSIVGVHTCGEVLPPTQSPTAIHTSSHGRHHPLGAISSSARSMAEPAHPARDLLYPAIHSLAENSNNSRSTRSLGARRYMTYATCGALETCTSYSYITST
jgi:hypothetical protein